MGSCGRDVGVSTATGSGSGTVPGEISARVGRRLYLPTVVMAGVTAWLSWRGWTALEDFGPARSISAGRYQLSGPVVIGFVLVVVLGAAALMAGTIVGFILARTVGIFGFHLTFSSGLAYTVLVVDAAAVVLLGITALLMPGPARPAA